jgi:hypothetical protein
MEEVKAVTVTGTVNGLKEKHTIQVQEQVMLIGETSILVTETEVFMLKQETREQVTEWNLDNIKEQ